MAKTNIRRTLSRYLYGFIDVETGGLDSPSSIVCSYILSSVSRQERLGDTPIGIMGVE
jgi:hypothetical protein